MAELGILLRSFYPIQVSTELVQEAERRGFHSVWITEGVDKDAYTQLAIWATKTERILMGSAITPVYTRTPVMAGMTMLSLAEISGERAILGIGTGHPNGVEGGHGLKLERPMDWMREYTEVVRLVTQKQQFSYKGQIFNIPNYNASTRDSFETRPLKAPIYLAALRSGMARLAGEVGDGVLMNMATPEHTRNTRDAFQQGARSAGKDPGQLTFASLVNASVSRDGDSSADAIRDWVARYPTLMPFYRRLLRDTGFAKEMEAIAPEVASRDVAAAAKKIPNEMLGALGAFGTAQQAREGLKPFEETGADLLVLHPPPLGKDTGQSVADLISAFAPK